MVYSIYFMFTFNAVGIIISYLSSSHALPQMGVRCYEYGNVTCVTSEMGLFFTTDTYGQHFEMLRVCFNKNNAKTHNSWHGTTYTSHVTCDCVTSYPLYALMKSQAPHDWIYYNICKRMLLQRKVPQISQYSTYYLVKGCCLRIWF